MNDLPNEANKKFVTDYKAKYKSSPSFYGSQTYDAAMLIDSGLKATSGDMSNKDALRKAFEKADFKSVRGNFKFGPNHIPIQNFYLQDVGEGGRRVPAQDRRHHRRERPGQALPEVQDAELTGGARRATAATLCDAAVVSFGGKLARALL